MLLLTLLPLAAAVPFTERSNVNIHPISITSPPPTSYVFADWPKSTFQKLGGFSPWFPATGVYGIPGVDVPDACTVDQVQVFMRHAERLTSGGTHKGVVKLANKLANSSYVFKT